MDIDNEIVEEFHDPTYPSHHPNHHGTELYPIADDEQSQPSHGSSSTTNRTKVSISSVSYLKDCKIVKTVQVDFDDDGGSLDRLEQDEEKEGGGERTTITVKPNVVDMVISRSRDVDDQQHLVFLEEQLTKSQPDLIDNISGNSITI